MEHIFILNILIEFYFRKKLKTSNISKNYVIQNSQIAGASRLDVPYINNGKPNLQMYSNNAVNDNNVEIDTTIDPNIAFNEAVMINEVSADDGYSTDALMMNAINADDDVLNDADISEVQNFVQTPIYTNYYHHAKSHLDFINNFKKTSFGHSCAVCDRLWWKNELKMASQKHEKILQNILPV